MYNVVSRLFTRTPHSGVKTWCHILVTVVTPCCCHVYLAIRLFMCAPHSGVRTWCYSPALPCHQSILRNVQCDLTPLKTNSQSGFLVGKVAIVLSHKLHCKFKAQSC